MSGLHHQHPEGRMSPVIQIIADEAVHYSTNNGITMLEYDPGELYEVPDHVAKGMIARNWAKLATGGEPRGPEPAKEAPPPPPVQEPASEPPPVKPDDQPKEDASAALQTKKRRSQ